MPSGLINKVNVSIILTHEDKTFARLQRKFTMLRKDSFTLICVFILSAVLGYTWGEHQQSGKLVFLLILAFIMFLIRIGMWKFKGKPLSPFITILFVFVVGTLVGYGLGDLSIFSESVDL